MFRITKITVLLQIALTIALKALLPAHAAEADVFFQATLFEQAAALYESELANGPPEARSELIVRLLHCYSITGQFDKIIKLAPNYPGHSVASYFLGSAYERQAQDEPAISAFRAYLTSGDSQYQEEALLKLGICCLHLDQRTEAQNCFQQIAAASSLFPMSQLYLGYLHLTEGRLSQAEGILNSLEGLLPAKNSFRYELCLLQGMMHYQKKAFIQAKECLAKALSKPQHLPSEWRKEALLYLGSCYANLADDPLKIKMVFEEKQEHPFSANGWYFRGLTILKKRKTFFQQNAVAEAHNGLKKAAECFEKAGELFYLIMPV